MRYYWLVVIFSFLLMIFSSCSNDEISLNLPFHATCDFETIEGDEFIGKGSNFSFDNNISYNESRSGEQSLVVGGENKFAANLKLGAFKKGNFIQISIWRKKEGNRKGSIVLSDELSGFRAEVSSASYVEDDWELLFLNLALPFDVQNLKFYVYNDDDQIKYFDDLKITVTEERPDYSSKHNTLHIKISNKEFTKLTNYRNQAIQRKQISRDLKKYVKSEIDYNGESISAKIRLKGDMIDHLIGDKWSFRIKLKNDRTIKGMNVFSIQSPNTRDFLNEWLMHKLFEEESILTTQYDFVYVRINGQFKGVYAIEEHFTKQLIETRKRRNGPIIKFDEELMWVAELNNDLNQSALLKYAPIVPFGSRKIKSDKVLLNQFINAQNILKSVQNFDFEIRNSFDVEKLAKYFALNELSNSYHGISYNNQRFYYNPVAGLLEPIAYDIYKETGINSKRRPIFSFVEDDFTSTPDWFFVHQFMNDKSFKKLYLKYLSSFSSESYLRDRMLGLKDEIELREKMLKQEYAFFNIDWDYFKSNAKRIAEEIPKAYEFMLDRSISLSDKSAFKANTNIFVKELSIRAFIQDTIGDQIKIRVQNFHTSDINIIGYSLAKHKDSMISMDSFTLKKFDGEYYQTEIILPLKTRRFHFTAANTGSEVHVVKLFKWKEPEPITVHENLKKSALSPSDIGMIENGKELSFKSGQLNLTRNLLIPDGYVVKIPPGTTIDLSNDASIISYSAIRASGLRQPIVIKSYDGTGRGVFVLGAKDTSYLESVNFDNLSNFQFQGWSQTGAVTFYDTHVQLKTCFFRSNRCEDALNLVNCEFTMTQCDFENTFADAFDADFSNGSLKSCTFHKVSNDAVDVSGSEISADDCKIDLAGDKGFSGGERSTLSITNAMISNCNIAVASKDASSVRIKDGKITKCHLAYAIYQKKPEYGQASMEVTNNVLNEIDQTKLVDRASLLTQDKKKIFGTIKVNVDSLYAQPMLLK